MSRQGSDPNTPPLYVSPEAEAIAGEIDGPPLPKWPKVIGIISIVFSSVSLVCGTGGTMMQMAGIGGGGRGFTQPPLVMGQYIYFAGNTVANLILLVGGILLVSRKPTARAALLSHALLKLPLSAYGVWVSLGYTASMVEAMRQSTVEQEAQMADLIGKFTLGMIGCGSLPGFGWPLFLAIWFLLVKKSAASIREGVTEQVA